MQMDNSSTCKGFSYSANSGESPEESSWTFYFQDFKSNNNNCSEQTSFCSDAASLAPYELITNRNNIGTLDINDNENNNKKFVGSKKRKMKGAAKVDDDLEDTASSPVNSPKVSYMDQFCNSQKGKSTASIIEGRGNNSGQQMMTSGLNISTKDNNDRTELKKKGLCLVPISMFRK
ncbi:vascular-related unknown protein 4-like [Lycium ferocissimum]|uniref:vascular-related unknown protein 4-like n=1 Tax=Lycium ferocissimum TaxID=112874 RepID=UPI00281648E7|nr:vascular-related unknown protein 4-like [Lycium ferocissimum]